MLLISARLLTLVFLFLGTLICGTFPLLLIACGNQFLSFLLNFGGGVLLSVSFLYLLPEVRDSYETYWGSNYVHTLRSLDLDGQPTGRQSSTGEVLLRGLVIVSALSFHSVIKGLAVGLQPSVKDTWTLFLAEAVHKFSIALALGLELYNEGTLDLGLELYNEGNAFLKVDFYMLLLTSMTTLGIGVVVLTDQSFSQLVVGTLNGLTCGTLIFVTCFEVLQRSPSSLLSGLLQLMAVVLGFGFMTDISYTNSSS
ncbi:zinc transporter ZIP2-like [Tachypleus tridentatus]|uniref:zinc transporter ZIP2-like n=1 Tax=Tachypleus tridentatus TaxID=6853 RepID=UPI003FD698D5